MATEDLEPRIAERANSLMVANRRVTQSLEQLRWSLGTLRHDLAVRADWRTYVRERPWLFVGGAFLLGFFIGSGRPGRSSTSRR